VPTELASCENGSISVVLFWTEATGELLVTVADAATGGSFALEIDGANALDAFYHPYAYASRLGISFADPLDATAAGDTLDVAEVVL
jgi:hypothetical protein